MTIVKGLEDYLDQFKKNYFSRVFVVKGYQEFIKEEDTKLSDEVKKKKDSIIRAQKRGKIKYHLQLRNSSSNSYSVENYSLIL